MIQIFVILAVIVLYVSIGTVWSVAINKKYEPEKGWVNRASKQKEYGEAIAKLPNYWVSGLLVVVVATFACTFWMGIQMTPPH